MSWSADGALAGPVPGVPAAVSAHATAARAVATHRAVDSFEEFVRNRSTSLFRTACLIVGDVPLAEDLVQTTLERAYRHWRRVSVMDHPEAYVRQIMVNLANDRWRRRRTVVEVTFDERLADTGRHQVDDPSLAVDQRAALIAGLRRLPLAMRTVLVLRYWEGLPEAEVAQLLGCSVGTVKSQASRGLARLRRSTTRSAEFEVDEAGRGQVCS